MNIRKKYDLKEGQVIANGWQLQNVDCSEHPQIFMDVDLIISTGVKNCNDGCLMYSDPAVKEKLKRMEFKC